MTGRVNPSLPDSSPGSSGADDPTSPLHPANLRSGRGLIDSDPLYQRFTSMTGYPPPAPRQPEEYADTNIQADNRRKNNALESDSDGDESDTGIFVRAERSTRTAHQQSEALNSNPSTRPSSSFSEPTISSASASSTSTPGVPTNYAHELKKALTQHHPANIAGAIAPRKRAPEYDPENYEIKRMRVEESRSWGDIARMLNDRRIANGQTPSLTEAAVYGRFVRNGPRIAAAHGEDFNPSDYMHLRNVKASLEAAPPKAPVEKFSAQHDALLVEAHHEVQQGFWDAVADRLQEKSGKKFTPEQCAKRYQQL